MELAHNHLGVDGLFQWGVVEHNGSHRVGVIAGGWEDSMLAPADGRDYLKLMSMYVLLLAQAAEDEEAEEAIEVTLVRKMSKKILILACHKRKFLCRCSCVSCF